MDDETPYKPPLPSRATRSFAARSKSSVRGFLFAHLPAQDRPRQIIYESNLERRVLLRYLARPDLADIWDQPPAIPYMAANGASRRHTPDFLVTLRAGYRVALAVKPLALVERRHFRNELELVRGSMSPAYADVFLVTDADLNDAQVRNAELLHIARQRVDADARQLIDSILANLESAQAFSDIVQRSGLGDRAWAALICALHEGEADVDLGRKIDGRTLIQ